jgi:hypothetical protein
MTKNNLKQQDKGNHHTNLRIHNLSLALNTSLGLTATTFLDASQSPVPKPKFTQCTADHISTSATIEAEEATSCPRPSREDPAVGPQPPHPRGSPHDHEEGPTPALSKPHHTTAALQGGATIAASRQQVGDVQICLHRPLCPPEAQIRHRQPMGMSSAPQI